MRDVIGRQSVGMQETQANYADKLTTREEMRNMTVGMNIDRQIADAEERLAQLRSVKRNLEDSGLMKLKIEDLRQAMQF